MKLSEREQFVWSYCNKVQQNFRESNLGPDILNEDLTNSPDPEPGPSAQFKKAKN
jgi:hypothetical protein